MGKKGEIRAGKDADIIALDKDTLKIKHVIARGKTLMENEEVVKFGDKTGVVFHTPGHTPGSLCFYFKEDNIVFSGDTLFKGGIGRTDLWGGDASAIEASVRERLYTLQESTQVIPGHGPETNIGFEQHHNPFISL